MRTGLLAASIAGCALSLGFVSRACDQATAAALSEEAKLAMELGCQGHTGRAAAECRDLLRRLYLAGSLDPDRTLRAYCDSVKTAPWGGSRPPPPKVCVDRYGGWRAG